MNDRIDWLTYAKSIGIILVVYGHVARGLYSAGIFTNVYIYQITDRVIYSFHMPLFFFLSGFLFVTSYNKRRNKIILNKIDTLVYPYILWSFFQGGIEASLSNYTNNNINFYDVFSLWIPIAQFWFLYALFLIFCIVVLIRNLINNRALFQIVLLLTSLLVYFTLYSYVPFISYNLIYFSLGIIAFYNKKIFLSLLSINCVKVFLPFVFLQILSVTWLAPYFKGPSLFSIILASVSIYFVIVLSLTIQKLNSKVLFDIGTSAMPIYFMHILIGSGLRVVLQKLFYIDIFALHLIVGCIAGVFIPIFIQHLIEKSNLKYIFHAPISKLVFPPR